MGAARTTLRGLSFIRSSLSILHSLPLLTIIIDALRAESAFDFSVKSSEEYLSMNMEMCQCGRKTEVKCNVELILWDGENDCEGGLLCISVKAQM